MSLGGVFFVAAFVSGIVLLVPLVIGAIFVVVVVSSRAEPDPSGRRPAAVYAFATTFLTLFVTLFASTALVAALCQLIGSRHNSQQFDAFVGLNQVGQFGGHVHPLGDAVARASVLSAIIMLVAGLVCALHLRAAVRATADAPVIDPNARVRSSYVAAVSFVSVTIVVIAAVVLVYDFFRGVAPGVFSSSGTGSGVAVLRSMIPALYLALAALAILLAHLRLAPPPFRPGVFGRWYGGPSPAAAEPAPITTPPPTDVAASGTRPAPRKRAPRKTTGGG
jgi:hypothetical protein